ncbi:HD domain-containing protein [Brachybacterium sp. EF45031]|uniref:[protein-PII] uridylyltransferase family protein n=1 Tax=Brachybacterium sillae TaxID=2810536 RepID=UPI00217E5AA5|nr:HD domain-containing protein [Brachybacterium sillae]MCS6712313.1 HD domain-containing protein [Brachybacterium sillae]
MSADPRVGDTARRSRSDTLDARLAQLWRTADGPATGAALLALDDLGRRTPGPATGLTLALIVDPELPDAERDQLATSLWHPLWATGERLDATVSTPQQAVATATTSLESGVRLLDLRFLAGDVDLAESAVAAVRVRWRATARSRVGDLTDLLDSLAARYPALAHAPEPTLATDRGGLRDIALIRALAESWLADHDHAVVDHADQVLLRARDALQIVTARPSTRLGRQDQEPVAALMGLRGADELLTQLAQASRVVQWQLQRSLRAATGAAAPGGRATVGSGAGRRPALERRDHGVIVQAAEVSVDPASRDPLRDLAAIRHAAVTGLPLSDATLRRLAADPPHHPLDPAQRDVLVDALAGEHLTTVYEALDVHGAWAPLIPHWSEVRNLPQRDTVHRFTVDRHQIETVREAAALLGTVERPDLLLLAALLHDLGRAAAGQVAGAEASATTRGAELAREAALALGCRPPDADRLGRVVAEHRTLLALAIEHDPDDESTLTALHRAVDGDAAQLALLRALTEADARATGPAAWTDRHADLVDHLTARLRGRLTRGAPDPAEELRPRRDALTRIRAEVARSGCPHVLLPGVRDHGDAEITLAAPPAPGVFAAITRVLVRFDLDVRRGTATSTPEAMVTTWWVTVPGRGLPAPAALRQALQREVERREDPAARVLEVPPTAPARRVGDIPVVSILIDPAGGHSVVQVNARNRPSLLADVAQTVTLHRARVRAAHVLTIGGRAVDTLHLTDLRGRPLPPAALEALLADLVDAASR